MSPPLRFAVVMTLFVVTGVFLGMRDHVEVLPDRQSLSLFPHQLQYWTGSDVTTSEDVRTTLGPGEFLLRIYRHNSMRTPVELFIAYFPSQRTGDTIHSPKNCLPGAGWYPLQSDHMVINVPGQKPLQVNRYIVANGSDRELVFYWYWAHNRAVASEYWAKFYLMADAARMNRSDGSLIRVTTAMAPTESAESAQARLLTFSKACIPLLPRYIPN